MNWNSPEERLALIESVGVVEYNRQLAKRQKEATMEYVNGYPLQKIDTQWGPLVQVVGTDHAFYKIEQARTFAKSQPPRPTRPAN